MATVSKPAKPYPDFPLFAHDNGQWAKKIRGKLFYFGPWADSDAALNGYLEQRDELHAGRTPQSKDVLTVKILCDRFISAKDAKMKSGEVSPAMRKEYKDWTDWLVQRWGDKVVAELRPSDFASLRSNLPVSNPHSVGNAIQRIRSVFRYAGPDGIELIPVAVKFGSEFRKPNATTMRRHAAKRAPIFTADEMRTIIGAADPQLTAMILLGINCGFGNSDCAELPQSDIDLKIGWHEFSRPKTGIERRAPLWPETVAALRAVIASRPKAKDSANDDLVFLTKHGRPWLSKDSVKRDDPISKKFRRLLIQLKLYKRGRNFYTLRSMCETLGGADQVAVDLIMGHITPGMGTGYRRTVADERLLTAANGIRTWLVGDGLKTLDKPLNVSQAARYIGVKVSAVYYWAESGGIETSRVGSKIAIPVAACEAMRVKRNTLEYTSAVVAGPATVRELPSDAA